MIFKYLTTLTECPCKKATEPDKDGLCPPCSNPKILDKMEQIIDESKKGDIKETKISNNTILNKMATMTSCDSERCVLESALILRYATPIEIKESLSNMKPDGPRENRDWLSNFNIDDCLRDYMDEYTSFYFFNSTMMDFKNQGEELGKVDKIPEIINTGKKSIGAIINTDKYSSCDKSGKCGKHWVCVFIDASKLDDTDWSVEYFDSVGDPPPSEIISWQKDVKEVLDKYRKSKGHTGSTQILVNTIRHQKQNNECGVYCLYFVRARTEGIDFNRFNNNKVSDEAMINFRRYIFS